MILICNLRSDVLSVTLVKFNKYVMERIAIFPGSFDPFTIGHEEIVKRGLKMFDKIVIAVGINAVKKEFLDVDTRIAIIRKVFEDVDNVIVMSYSGLTVDFCEQISLFEVYVLLLISSTNVLLVRQTRRWILPWKPFSF